MNFFKNIFKYLPTEISVGKFIGNKKHIITDAFVSQVNPSVIIFFVLPTDLPTDKKLPTKNSPMENFLR